MAETMTEMSNTNNAQTTTWLIRISSAPNFSTRTIQGIDAVLACGAFGQSVTVVLDREALGLLTPELGAVEGERNLYQQITSLPLYDIEQIFVVTKNQTTGNQSHDHHPFLPEIEDLTLTPISETDFATMVNHANHVLSF